MSLGQFCDGNCHKNWSILVGFDYVFLCTTNTSGYETRLLPHWHLLDKTTHFCHFSSFAIPCKEERSFVISLHHVYNIFIPSERNSHRITVTVIYIIERSAYLKRHQLFYVDRQGTSCNWETATDCQKYATPQLFEGTYWSIVFRFFILYFHLK